MSKWNMKAWVADLISQPAVRALPVMTHPGIEINGNTVTQAVSDGQIHYNAVRALCARYPSVAAATIMDLTVEAEAFGATVHFSADAVPAVVGRLLPDERAIAQLEVPPLNKGRIP
ncbi:MAG: methylcobamide--CoM methyltransferase, partial [Prevotellaceae bacterium]|nr:methylcobamide--CoM methyltransferase [Prevotellaceae bacterium]